MSLAHVVGLPVEEALAAVGGGMAGLAVARGWIMLRVRSRREAGR